MEDLLIRPYQPGDEEEILATFNLVFREVCGEGYVDRKMDHWRWEFLDNPLGQRTILALTPEKKVAAQYAAVPVAAHSPLGKTSFVHVVDSMVHPDFRKGLKKPGLFVECGQTWSRYIGEVGKEAMAFGYPVRIAYRIGNRYLSYDQVRVMDYQVLDVRQTEPPSIDQTGLEVERVSLFPEGEINQLWEEWSGHYECAVIRDFTYLNWRYSKCPSTDYLGLLARRNGKLVGLAVINPCNELVPESATFADWMVLPGEAGACRALIGETHAIARENERQNLMILLPPWCSDSALFTKTGFKTIPSRDYFERRMVATFWKEMGSLEWLADHWYYTLGDSDLV